MTAHTATQREGVPRGSQQDALLQAHGRHRSMAERQARGVRLNDLQRKVIKRAEAEIAFLEGLGVRVAKGDRSRTGSRCQNGQAIRIDGASRDNSTPMDAPWEVDAVMIGGPSSGSTHSMRLTDDQANSIAVTGPEPPGRHADDEEIGDAMLGRVVAMRTVHTKTPGLIDISDVFEAPQWAGPGTGATQDDAQAWKRQLEWGTQKQWIAIAYCESTKAAQNLITETEKTVRSTGGVVATVREVAGKSVPDTLTSLAPAHTGVLVIDCSAQREAKLAETILAMNRGRERTRRLARDGVLIILPEGAHTLVRDLAPDIRSASTMTWWPKGETDASAHGAAQAKSEPQAQAPSGGVSM